MSRPVTSLAYLADYYFENFMGQSENGLVVKVTDASQEKKERVVEETTYAQFQNFVQNIRQLYYWSNNRVDSRANYLAGTLKLIDEVIARNPPIGIFSHIFIMQLKVHLDALENPDICKILMKKPFFATNGRSKDWTEQYDFKPMTITEIESLFNHTKSKLKIQGKGGKEDLEKNCAELSRRIESLKNRLQDNEHFLAEIVEGIEIDIAIDKEDLVERGQITVQADDLTNESRKRKTVDDPERSNRPQKRSKSPAD